ncbi:hypothetical protein N3K66_006463 [Trichothecium roseum]|uniref:Uncharacterized protein n=1 Tax=Trichothecium roseum TaxID=47278 RepID=A0ACC0UW04_9HYPO|nr:hypothetical protein N3K66_006463 [Trichothecium roseum]
MADNPPPSYDIATSSRAPSELPDNSTSHVQQPQPVATPAKGTTPSSAVPAPTEPGVYTQPQPQPTTQTQTPPIQMQPMTAPPMNPHAAQQKVTPLHLLSETPQWIDCHFCRQRTKTVVKKDGAGLQFLTGAVLCLVCICLAPLPCCLNWFEETHWYCSNCNKQVAHRVGDHPLQPTAPPQAHSQPTQYATGVPPEAQAQHQAQAQHTQQSSQPATSPVSPDYQPPVSPPLGHTTSPAPGNVPAHTGHSEMSTDATPQQPVTSTPPTR